MPNFISMEVNGTIIEHDIEVSGVMIDTDTHKIRLNLDYYVISISATVGLVFIYHRCSR